MNDYSCLPFYEHLPRVPDDGSKLDHFVSKVDGNIINLNIKYIVQDEVKLDFDVKECMYDFDEFNNLLTECGFKVKLCSKDFGFVAKPTDMVDKSVKWKFILSKQ